MCDGGGNCLKYLGWKGVEQKIGEEKQILKGGGQAGLRGGCLKMGDGGAGGGGQGRGAGTPLQTI